MQKISLVLNVLLILAVGYLFGQHLKDKKNSSEDFKEVTTVSETDGRTQRIAFVNIDSLDLKYQFVEDGYEALGIEQKKSRSRLDQKMKEAETRYMQLQKDAVYMTQEQLKGAEAELQGLTIKMQNLEQELTEKIQTMRNEVNKEYQENLKAYLDEYVKGKDIDCVLGVSSIGSVLWAENAFDITDVALEKMNADYQASLAEEEE